MPLLFCRRGSSSPFTISFHIIFPTFTTGLAVWRTVLEALHLAGRSVYRQVFEFWLRIFVFPLMLLYTAISYSVFRGKIRSTSGHH
jgi:cytochrome bd-type quinol oxidase subunit 2